MATRIVFLKKIEAKNPVLLTGLPGIGLVGKICVDYLLKQFKAEKIAEIFSDSFPPSVHTFDSQIELIKDELYYCKINNEDFLFLAGPVQPSLDASLSSAQEHYEFARAIVEAVAPLGVKEIYTLAGINVGDARMVKEPGIVVAATSKKMIADLKKIGAITQKHDGLISGVAGLLLGIAKEKKIEGACLMGETNASLIYGDHGAAKKLIEFLVKLFGFNVKMEEIEKESKNIEKAFTQLAKQFEQEEDKPPKSGLSYVR
jgi:uncharacterized protein (TIGR00162 family)